ncbi:DNA glycosylase AlkZ-like family protein [Actinomadura sp. HBU206391]|uniref:DNA glycosylase AlkZ-like family protein n=1 Tax=Actinomadura sp. HBU206391 TaxID=2731692 RepID=UPI00164FFF84|nr:crosslink repair DNA glycosylase YcaQ family protein [Actinomadura sp. HBU206391]MBC6459978.1 winged helix DNA-binding domain-containing protein [Actinomadura sp. HBU206391]
MAYRVAAHGLDRKAGDLEDLAVFDLGVQDTPSGSARPALAARSATPPAGDLEGLSLVWTFRGAPHLHRTADLPGLATALWPLSDADATARFTSTRIKEGARLGLAAFTAAAEAMREVVGEPRPRGEVSTEVTARIPASLTYDCVPCKARHVSGALFQQVGLPAGVLVQPGTSPAVLAPIAGRPEVPREAAGTAALVEAYLRLHGPATLAEVASYIGTTQRELAPAWPDGLAEVRVDGRRAWLPADRVDVLRSAAAPSLVRLLPPSDPFLQARDRSLLVPDKARHSELWKAISKPGALLVDGEIDGLWRARKAGRTRLEITVTPFRSSAARVRAAIEEEAGRVAAARGVTDVRVLFDG